MLPHDTEHPKHIEALDGLRFIAALLVWLGHSLGILLPVYKNYAVCFTSPGMSLFFILSGIVIHYNYNRIAEGRGTKEFIVARVSRLCPLYFAVLLIAIITGRHTLHASFLLYLVLMQSWFYHPSDTSLIYEYGGWAAITWSISAEMFFYLFYVVAARTIKSHPVWVGSVAAGCAAVWHGSGYYFSSQITAWSVDHFGAIAADDYYGFMRWLLYFSPYARLPEFVMGCVICQRLPLKFPKILGAPILLILGHASYSIYLLHGIAIIAAAKMPVPVGVQYLLAALITIAASLLCYHCYEVPMKRVTKHLLLR